jgi:1-deoxy-D-xylulose-5-phosphate reductoisomerase
MKKKIALIGSTGSIGSSLLEIIDLNNFDIIFLAANKNYKKLLNQANRYNAKNIILCDYHSYLSAIKFNKNHKIKIFYNFKNLNNIIKKKLDYVMSSFSGINGLEPTFKIIKFTKKIAIANKETLICAWPLIKKELLKNKTEFVPVDSEHFSIWNEIKNININNIKKIYLTASGGPLLDYNKKKNGKINHEMVLRHPTWKMGKKITVDSATLMNKCFEVMEAKSIFNLNYNKIKILIHPDSYVHAIIMLNNGFSKIILHETTMKIPIFNTIYSNNKIYDNLKPINLKKLNKLNFQKVNINKFPITKILKMLPQNHSLFETVIVAINDVIVNNFLAKKIHFNDIPEIFFKNIKKKKYTKYKNINPKKISDIINLNNDIQNSCEI